MNYALITAGGVGSRMKMDIPKQFLEVKGKPVIVYTLEKFQQHPEIDGVCVVCLEGWLDDMQKLIDTYGLTKVRWIAKGGANGQESIVNGVTELSRHIDKEDIVLITDGNRPLVTPEIISDAIDTCRTYGSAVSHTPMVEAIYTTEEDYATISKEQLCSRDLLDRTKLIRAQTPNAFPLKKLLWAYDEAAKRGITNCVASCTLMTELGERVYFSLGSAANFKITTQDDLLLFEAVLERGTEQ